MTAQAWLALLIFLAVLTALAYPLSIYISRIADPLPIGGIAGRIEHAIYRVAGVDSKDMTWTRYAIACCCSTPSVWSSSMRFSACSSGCR